MDERNDGGPAFPLYVPEKIERFTNGGLHRAEQMIGGMTLRDYFAGKALQGLMANSSEAVLVVLGKDAALNGETETEQTFSRLAYAQADAMLAERAKRSAK